MKQLSLLLSLLFISTLTLAQTGTIRGKIIEDETGFEVIGANVLIQELGTGTVTDLDGAFSMDLEPGSYTLQISYIGYQSLTIEDVVVTPGEVTLVGEVRIAEASEELAEVVVTARAIRNTESALMTIKRKSPQLLDGISSAKFRVTGDATAVEAAKRVTGVSIEGGKYVFVRGLGDRYSKTTLNGMEIPGLDPDRNTLQMDIFPTNLIDNIVVSKNFTAEMPADFTGGLLNIETKDFPDERILNVAVSTTYNPQYHFNSDYLTYDGGGFTDLLGFDDGTRQLPDGADATGSEFPLPPSPETNSFVNSFDKELGARNRTSALDFNASISIGDQIELGSNKVDGNKLGYIFSLSYKNDYNFYDEAFFGEYQRESASDVYDLTYAITQDGAYSERNILVGALGGLAFKSKLTKIRLTVMRLQNGEKRTGQFFLDDNGEAAGRSGYFAVSDNLEYNQRELTNIFLGGTHLTKESGWEFDWRGSATFSSSDDPDIRKTAWTRSATGLWFFQAGAGGNPTRIWRYLDEVNAHAKIDITKNYTLFEENAKLKFGVSEVFKQRDYEILSYDVQFFGPQPDWPQGSDAPDPNIVLDPENIFGNGSGGTVYYSSGNANPNPNAYSSNVLNTGVYVSNDITLFRNLKTILGVRAEYYVQRHTGRDQQYASSGGLSGRNLDNEKVLDALDFFPSVNLIYGIGEKMNIRGSYSRTIARPSFKELSFAQILDPVSNRIFNGSFFPYDDVDGNVEWDGNLTETRINNLDLRWEYFLEGGQLFSVSGFYKTFDNPIELVRIPRSPTGAEFQPRNVGNGQLYGVEIEVRKSLDFVSPSLSAFSLSSNVTLLKSEIDMTNAEFKNRKIFERAGENITNTRVMAGQSPWVVNAGLSYSNPEIGLDGGIFYNVKGPTLTVVGSGRYPDVYAREFHSLNFSIIKKLGRDYNTAIRFKVDNILNDKVESYFSSFEAEEELFQSINPGVSFGLGVSHRF